jgi:hypothetical protein
VRGCVHFSYTRVKSTLLAEVGRQSFLDAKDKVVALLMMHARPSVPQVGGRPITPTVARRAREMLRDNETITYTRIKAALIAEFDQQQFEDAKQRVVEILQQVAVDHEVGVTRTDTH